MKRVMTLIGCALLATSASATSPTKEWRGIKPLRSTRADVERLLGAAPKGALVVYDLPDEKVSVAYEMRKCEDVAPAGWPDLSPGWNVPENTVVSVNIALKGYVTLASLNIDLSRFKKEGKESDVPQVLRYRDEKEGFGIEVFAPQGGAEERVRAFFFVPTKEDDERLRCPARKPSDSR